MIIIDYAIADTRPGGTITTPNREALREGIDNISYIYRLGQKCVFHAENHPDALRSHFAFVSSTTIA